MKIKILHPIRLLNLVFGGLVCHRTYLDWAQDGIRLLKPFGVTV